MNIQIGPSYDRWHHEGSEIRPLSCAVTWVNKMQNLIQKSSRAPNWGQIPILPQKTDIEKRIQAV